MKVVIIGSGSKGNCTFIESNGTKILLDAGISLLQIRRHLAEYGLNLDGLSAVFVTHEHIDHVRYLVSVLEKTKATLYIDSVTYRDTENKLRTSLNQYPHNFIVKDTRYTIGTLDIVPIELSHDVNNCFGYLVREGETNNTYASITDTGYIPSRYFNVLSKINTMLIESNHDIEMLKHSTRPESLIERILSDHGHMNNVDTAEVLKAIYTPSIKNVILGHISEECNLPEIALNTVVDKFNGSTPFNLYAAEQYNSMYLAIGEAND